jgi:hypothetical protein
LPVRRRRVLWCWCPLRSQFTPAQSPLKLKLIVDDLRMTRDDTSSSCGHRDGWPWGREAPVDLEDGSGGPRPTLRIGLRNPCLISFPPRQRNRLASFEKSFRMRGLLAWW